MILIHQIWCCVCFSNVHPPVGCSLLVFPGSGGEPGPDLQSGSSRGFVGQQRSLRKHWRKYTVRYCADKIFNWVQFICFISTLNLKTNSYRHLPATPSSRTSPSSMRCTIGRTAAQMHAGKTAWGGCNMWWVGVCSVVFSSSGNKQIKLLSGH